MILIKSLEYSYHNDGFKLKIPELSIKRGEKVALIGPNGSGKTTLLNLIAGILIPETGAVNVDNVQINELSDDSRREFRITNIGYVFQEFQLLDYLDVLDNILHPFRITGALELNSHIRENAAMLAGQMGIGDKLNRYPNNLSQGEKQRAAICRALLPQPKVILADEATGNLDPDNKIRILELLFRSVENQKATLLAVTHDYELLDKFDRVLDFSRFHKIATV